MRRSSARIYTFAQHSTGRWTAKTKDDRDSTRFADLTLLPRGIHGRAVIPSPRKVIIFAPFIDADLRITPKISKLFHFVDLQKEKQLSKCLRNISWNTHAGWFIRVQKRKCNGDRAQLFCDTWKKHVRMQFWRINELFPHTYIFFIRCVIFVGLIDTTKQSPSYAPECLFYSIL